MLTERQFLSVLRAIIPLVTSMALPDYAGLLGNIATHTRISRITCIKQCDTAVVLRRLDDWSWWRTIYGFATMSRYNVLGVSLSLGWSRCDLVPNPAPRLAGDFHTHHLVVNDSYQRDKLLVVVTPTWNIRTRCNQMYAQLALNINKHITRTLPSTHKTKQTKYQKWQRMYQRIFSVCCIKDTVYVQTTH